MSNRVIALTWPPAKLNTSSPFARATPDSGSSRYAPKAGCPLALVATNRNLVPGSKTKAVTNLATRSRPWYSSGIGGMVIRTSSASSATRSATAPRS